MKKLLAVLLSAVMVLGVSACGSSSSSEEPAEETTSAKEEGEENGETTDARQPV